MDDPVAAEQIGCLLYHFQILHPDRCNCTGHMIHLLEHFTGQNVDRPCDTEIRLRRARVSYIKDGRLVA